MTVTTGIGPIKFQLYESELDDRTEFEQEMALVRGEIQPAVEISVAEPSGREEGDQNPLANCHNLDIDANTGDVICAD